MSGLLARLAPAGARRAYGFVRAAAVRGDVLGELQAIARSNRPVIAGPWVGEVGFELLYWVPFLRWAREAVALDPSRVTAVSRGGPRSWYRDVAAAYADVFDLTDVERFRAGNARRQSELGEHKQVRRTRFDDELVEALRARGGYEDAIVLHPSLMYRLVRPYWWRHVPRSWVMDHASYRRIDPPPVPASLSVAPGQYVVVKFYDNDCFGSSEATRTYVDAIVAALARRGAVVSLTTGLSIDEHAPTPTAGTVTTIKGLGTARNNLEIQTGIVGHAHAFVGTYGGFSYLAPQCGVPSLAVYDHPGFNADHLDLMTAALPALATPSYQAVRLGSISPDDAADAVWSGRVAA